MNQETRNAICDFGRMMSGTRKQKFILVPIDLARIVHRAARQTIPITPKPTKKDAR